MTPHHSSIRRPSLQEIRGIFPSATGVGIALPEIGRGLVVGFNRLAIFGDELKIAGASSQVTHAPLFELTRTFGFVVLKNCRARDIPDKEASKLSHGKDSDGKFIQDPFHYDIVPPENNLGLPPDDYMSAIYKNSPEAREEDTLYALEGDVKEAIRKLDKDDLPDEVVDALSEMERPDYHFRLYHPQEQGARQIVRAQYPDFVEDVYRLIPDGRKYRQAWLKDQWDIFIHANTYRDGLHARPTGHMMMSTEVPSNPLCGLYLFK